MRQAVVGLLAHVDAGKTTLAEALLHQAGVTRRLGRVDHGDAYLDFAQVERERGITVFSKQATLDYQGAHLMLLDAPGHVDFCAEAERTLQVLDLCVLVVAANEGLRGHTKTLWRLLAHYGVPTIVFVNKLDLYAGGRDELMARLAAAWGDACVDFARVADDDVQEAMAVTDEAALEEYLEHGVLGDETVRSLVGRRSVIPCLFGCALREEGTTALLDALAFMATERAWPQEFAARVYKVSHEEAGKRVAWVKVCGGVLRAKQTVSVAGPTGEQLVEKVDQLRIYNGAKYTVVPEVAAGQVCAATGLSHAVPGTGLGALRDADAPVLSPVLDYAVQPRGCDVHAVHEALRRLAEEDPLLGVTWDEQMQETRVQLMGAVQLEVVQGRLRDDFGLAVEFGTGSVLYKETIAAPVQGVGHFEPLRHYAEVHLLLEPLARGAGMEFGTVCPEDDLDRNWQRLILTNAMERAHRGVLVGAPLTDVRITLLAGRAHPKHTEGGDFRQATYRAIRQALMGARSVLLEPWYAFELELPASKVGRALSDLQRMGARFEPPRQQGEDALVVGRAPASTMGSYALEVSAYTAGQGSLHVELAGYEPCHDAEDVMRERAYEPEADLPNTPDSVFCSHGAGYTVKWHEVAAAAHVKPDPSARRPWVRADDAFFGTPARG